MINQNNIIEKSRNVVAMQCLNMSEGELKILDVYLSRINPRDKETRSVMFTKREYEELIGVDRIRVERIEEYIEHLMQNLITIEMPHPNGRGNTILKYTLFPSAKLEWDEDALEYKIYLSINEALDAAFFNIQNLGYIKYRLRNVIKLKRKYDIKLYLALKLYEHSQPYECVIGLDKLKKIIECNSKGYNDYAKFNNKVLKPAVEHINDFTDILVDYKKPRKRTNEPEIVKFIISKKKLKEKVTEIQEMSKPELTPYGIPEDVYADEDFDLDVLKLKIASVYPNDEVKLLEILGKANIRYDSQKAKVPFLYYLGIVKKILEEPLTGTKEKAANQKPNRFHNFEQREYDYEALLRQINSTADLE